MRQAGRAWFAVTALVVLGGLVVQLTVAAGATTSPFAEPAYRVLNVLAYFTIWSNILVGATSLLLALDSNRRSILFRTLRLDGVVCIAITFVVFHLVLAGLQDLHGAAAFSDLMLHTVAPLLCVVGWAVFGPRHAIAWRTVVLALIFPLAWLVFTLVRGAIFGWYPYPFLDATTNGYGYVAISCLAVAVLFLAFAAGCLGADRLFARWAAPARR